MATPPTERPRRTRGGVSPFVGFRLEKDLVARVERLSGQFADAAARSFLSAPDRSAVMNAIVRQGVTVLEAHFRLSPALETSTKPPPTAVPAADGTAGASPRGEATPAVERGPSGLGARPAGPKKNTASKGLNAKGRR